MADITKDTDPRRAEDPQVPTIAPSKPTETSAQPSGEDDDLGDNEEADDLEDLDEEENDEEDADETENA